MTIEVVLYQPEIPPNTGNVARTCVAVGAALHLIRPLGFRIDAREVRRAGLDYWPRLELSVHDDWGSYVAHAVSRGALEPALFTTRATQSYRELPLAGSDAVLPLVFGPETRGLPDELLAAYAGRGYRIPMKATERSLNLGNAVAIVVYDVLARTGFPGLQ